MSFSKSSNMNNSTNTYKNPQMSESSESFYKTFRKLCNTTAENENLILELLNLDYQHEENYKFSVYYMFENINKILEYYNNPNDLVFRNSMDKFISNGNFKYLLENEFLRTLIEKESSKFFDTKNLKSLNMNNTIQKNPESKSFLSQAPLVSKDDNYCVKQSNKNIPHQEELARSQIPKKDNEKDSKEYDKHPSNFRGLTNILNKNANEAQDHQSSNNCSSAGIENTKSKYNLKNTSEIKNQEINYTSENLNYNINHLQNPDKIGDEFRRPINQQPLSPSVEPEIQKINEITHKEKYDINNSQNHKNSLLYAQNSNLKETNLSQNLTKKITSDECNRIKSNESQVIENIVNNVLLKQNKNFSSQKYSDLKSQLKPSNNENEKDIKNPIVNNFNIKLNKILFKNNNDNNNINQNNILSYNNPSNSSGIYRINNQSLQKSILKNHSNLKSNGNESYSIQMKSKNIDLNYSYFRDPSILEKLKSRNRMSFYSLFALEKPDPKNGKLYKKFDCIRDYYKELAKYPQNKINEIYQKLFVKANYSDIDQELRLLYLNYFVLINPFLSPNQMENLEKEIIDVYLLNNKALGDFSSESQKFYKEAFLNPPKKKAILNQNIMNNNDFANPNNMNNDWKSYENSANPGSLLHENIINDFFQKKDSFNDTNIFSVFENIRKIKNLKNLYKILIYDDMLHYLKPEIKIKIKFFFYILIQYFEKLSKNKSLLDCLYIFKFFFYDVDNTPNPDNEYESNFCFDLAKIPFTKTGFKEMDHNIKNLFKKKFFKNSKSLEINGINLDNIYISFNIEDVFAKGEIAIFEEVMSKIKFFYSKNLERKKAKLSLLAQHNINFVFNILDFADFKAKQNINYKKVFYNLEKDMIIVYEQLLGNKLNPNSNFNNNVFNSRPIINIFNNDDSALYFYPYKIYKKQKEAFDQLGNFVENFTDNFNNNRRVNGNKVYLKAKLLPFGSITQLVGGPNADLDLYLDLQIESSFYDNYANNENDNQNVFTNEYNRINNHNNFNNYNNNYNKKNYNDYDDAKAKYIWDLHSGIKNTILKNNRGTKLKAIVTKRLITITFEYFPGSRDSVNVDINFHNCLGVLNSSLLRTYSLIDQRFSILTIYLKHIVKEYGIKRDEIKQDRINSYSWTFILLTFLQDVIQPPVLPKILSHLKSKNEIFKIKTKIAKSDLASKDTKKFKQKFNPSKNFFGLDNIKEFLMLNKEETEHVIPNFLNLLDEENPEDKKFLEDFYKNNKNEMSVAEIFFAFLEFVTFYFKFETNFVYTAGNDKEEGFYGKHLLKTQEFNDIGMYFRNKTALMRDPLDIGYNPLSNIEEKSLKTITDGLKKCYQDIISKKN